jgi:outer membrane receptor protein involved in Fe transport
MSISFLPAQSARAALLTIVMSALCATAAYADDAKKTTQSTVSGAVNDALNRPLTEVTVSLKAADGHIAASTKTDAQGHFIFSAVAAGNYEVTADKTDFVHGSGLVSVAPDQKNATIALTLAGTQALSVQVKPRHLQRSRNAVSAQTGGSLYRLSDKDIENIPQGTGSGVSQALLQAPGVAQDSYGQLHIRGDHGDLQYRLNGIILPESIAGFGQTLDTRFAQSMSLLTGALPAQYGYRTAGVVEIQTKTGAFANGGSIGINVGSYDTREIHADVSGSHDNFNYYLSGSILSNELGIENPTASKNSLHDETQQGKGFAYFSWLVGDASRISLIVGTTASRFQIPNVPDQPQNFSLANYSAYPSTNLNERQRENTHYSILAFQGTAGDRFDYQVSVFSRYTDVYFSPDTAGDLIYTGTASRITRSGWANGLQADGTYKLNDSHTLRMGTFLSAEHLNNDSDILAFPVDALGNQSTNQPVTQSESSQKNTYLAGIYLQDEWKITDKLTANYGARFDQVNAYVSDNALSPRAGVVYQLTPQTTLHAGYARYFTPPPSELVSTTTIAASQGTTAAPPGTQNDAVQSETSDYYDVGISQKITPQLTVGVDGYYKRIKNMLDEGQFGSALLFTPFNYAEGKVYGVEITSSYRQDNFSAYLNVARSTALGKSINSSQYLFDGNELNYIANNWVHLDHDQTYTASGGVAYVRDDITYSADVLAGSGLRRGFANTESLPGYMQANVSVAHTFVFNTLGKIEAHASVVNIFDHVYEIRDGSGIGVGAPQYGTRRGFYAGVNKIF